MPCGPLLSWCPTEPQHAMRVKPEGCVWSHHFLAEIPLTDLIPFCGIFFPVKCGTGLHACGLGAVV